MPIPLEEPPIKREDSTPTLAEQCKNKSWGFGFYNFGLGEAENRTFFNCGLVERKDGLWLLARVSEITNDWFGLNSVYAFMLDASGKVPKVGHKLEWTDSVWNEQFEDARGVYFPSLDQTAIACCNFIWRGDSWTGALQVVGFFDNEWQCKIKHRPPIGGNPPELRDIEPKQYEKSWVPFFYKNKLHILYSSKPWMIYEFGDTWEDNKAWQDTKGVSWKYGIIRGGTPPVLVDGKLWTFFHSSLKWQGNYRRYYMGAIAFENKPPFKPLLITPEPLLAGSQNDPWAARKPPCIFPCGAIYRDEQFFITAGVNDVKCAWIELSYDSLKPLMQPIGDGVTPILPQTGLSNGEIKKQQLRERAANARAVLAKMRENGQLKPFKRKRKRVALKAK